MQVDFYQLGGSPLEQVTSTLAQRLLSEGSRLLVVADYDSDGATASRDGEVTGIGTSRRHAIELGELPTVADGVRHHESGRDASGVGDADFRDGVEELPVTRQSYPRRIRQIGHRFERV